MARRRFGSTTSIFWKRRVSAWSFSKMPRTPGRCRADQRSSAVGERRLIRFEASITPPRRRPHRSRCGCSIDEQDRARQLLQLRDTPFRRLLEVAAVLCACDERAQVERVDRAAPRTSGTLPSTIRRASPRPARSCRPRPRRRRAGCSCAAATGSDGALDLERRADQGSMRPWRRAGSRLIAYFSSAELPSASRCPPAAGTPRRAARARRPAWRARARCSSRRRGARRPEREQGKRACECFSLKIATSTFATTPPSCRRLPRGHGALEAPRWNPSVGCTSRRRPASGAACLVDELGEFLAQPRGVRPRRPAGSPGPWSCR